MSQIVPIDASVAATVIVFAVAFGAVWLYRRIQIRHLDKQKKYYSLFCKQVSDFRQRVDMPVPIREFVEELVTMPTDGKVVRKIVLRSLAGRPARMSTNARRSTDAAIRSLEQLDEEMRREVANLIVTFAFALVHSSLFYGWLFEKFRLHGLSRRTQAEIVMETVPRQTAPETVAA